MNMGLNKLYKIINYVTNLSKILTTFHSHIYIVVHFL